MSSERSPRMGAPALLPAPPRRSLDLLLPPVLGVSATHGALRDWRGTVARGGAFGAWALGSTLHLEGALLGSPAPPLGSGQSLVAVPSLRLSLWGAQGPGCASIPTQTARRQGEQGAKEGGWVRRPCTLAGNRAGGCRRSSACPTCCQPGQGRRWQRAGVPAGRLAAWGAGGVNGDCEPGVRGLW